MEIRKLDTYAMIAASKHKDSDSEKLGAHAGSPPSRFGKDPMGDEAQSEEVCILHVW